MPTAVVSHLIGLVVALLVAILVAPLIPYPGGLIVEIVAYIVAAVMALYLLFDLTGGFPRR